MTIYKGAFVKYFNSQYNATDILFGGKLTPKSTKRDQMACAAGMVIGFMPVVGDVAGQILTFSVNLAVSSGSEKRTNTVYNTFDCQKHVEKIGKEVASRSAHSHSNHLYSLAQESGGKLKIKKIAETDAKNAFRAVKAGDFVELKWGERDLSAAAIDEMIVSGLVKEVLYPTPKLLQRIFGKK